ncbi:hypothetical protein [Dokdonia sp. Asnod1-B02]|uniref:hypothetical protein n=1 Tax=Dokdonia sp. Asnod1-B02 TaxID=3160573 RepID=UPI00386E768B
MNSSKEMKKLNFDAWVDLIDERILDWRNGLNTELKCNLDFSIDSLDLIEKYLFENFTLESIKSTENKLQIDGAASYAIKVFEKHWTNSQYVIELDDKKNVLYNRPAIITNPPKGAAFSPYMFIPAIINLKKTGIFRKNLESRL